MIRVAVLDDHEAIRAGLNGLLRSEPGIVPVGTAADEGELWPLLSRTRPDVVIVDFQLPGRHGLLLCRRIKATVHPPRVMVYSAFANDSLVLPARLAGADAVVAKSATADELFEVLRALGRGRPMAQTVGPAQLRAAASLLPPEDLPVVGMLVEGTRPTEVGQVLGLDQEALGARVERIIGRLVSATRA